MSASIVINPSQTTNAAGSFNISSTGWIQGVALDDPALRNELAGGILAPTETLPMWGGVGISETATPVSASPPFPISSLGGYITRATTIGQSSVNGLTGFSVYNQDHAAINTPQSPAPLVYSGGLVNFFRLGSGIRIPLLCAESLVAALEGNIIGTQASWDFNGQQLVPYVAPYPANVLTAASWASTGGGQVTFTTTTSHGVAVGDFFTISGMVPAGYNGDYVAITGTTGSTLIAAQATNPGSETVLGTLVAGGGAVPVRILEVSDANSMTVQYSPTTGFATWNRTGTVAVCLI